MPLPTPSRFVVVEPFTLLRTRTGTVFDHGEAAKPEHRELPVHCEYLKGVEYDVSPEIAESITLAGVIGIIKFL